MFVNISFAQSLSSKQNACKEKLLEELKTQMSKDNGLIQAQLSITAMKLARKVIERKYIDKDKEVVRTIESYIHDIVGDNTVKRLDDHANIQNDILESFNKYSGNTKYNDANIQLDRLRWQDKMSDEDISKYMIQMQTIWKGKDDFGFDEKDYSMAWFVNKVNKNATGKESHFISNTIAYVLSDMDKADKKITLNFKKAQLELKAGLQSLKHKVYQKYKDLCLDLYNAETNENTQNVSIFEGATCDRNEINLLDGLFTKSLENILSGLDTPAFVPKKISIKNGLNLTPKQKRKAQDWINTRPSDKERIIQYYENGLSQNRCDGFLIVDKKNKKTSLYLNDGTEVMTSPAVIGVGNMGKSPSGSYRKFNPDAILRKWNYEKAGGGRGTKYSRTTGAGIFYVDKSLTPDKRKERKYDEEFNDRVLVIYSKREDPTTGKIYKKEETQAVHGVPNKAWVKSSHKKRMQSFEDDGVSGKNLSSGCVNLEGYTYDIINEFLGNDCPMYVLPEDPENYFVVKNGELIYSTGNKLKKSGKENAKIKSLTSTIDDPRNQNFYIYTPENRKIVTQGHDKTKFESSVLDQIFENKEKLINAAKTMDNDDFQDFTALTYAMTNDKSKAERIFKDLYNSLYRYKESTTNKNRERLEMATMKQRRAIILNNYIKYFGGNYELISTLEKAKEVEFVE